MWGERVISSPKIKKVKILKTSSASALEENINNALEDGWELYGEPCLNDAYDYYATMVKYEEVEE